MAVKCQGEITLKLSTQTRMLRGEFALLRIARMKCDITGVQINSLLPLSLISTIEIGMRTNSFR